MGRFPKRRMTVDEFLAWSETVPGRHELVAGECVATAPERVRHAQTKFSVQTALKRGLLQHGCPCQMLPDGMTVRIDAHTAYEPDALVYCGPRLDPEAVEVPEPVIVVEVLSPGTRGVDTGRKLAGYFQVPSLVHYLVIDPVQTLVIHHRRAGERIDTSIVAQGSLSLDPPGIDVSLADFFE